MAKLIGPLFSESAHGKLAQRLIYSRRKEGNICRSFHMPDKKITLNQWAQRHLIGLLTAHWQVKSDAEKLLYEDLANTSGLQISGFNYFIKVAHADLRTHHGLIGYWPMNEAAGNYILDASGAGLHGSLLPTPPTDCPSRIAGLIEQYGNALRFDGINDYVDFGSSPAFTVTDKITAEAWLTIPSGGENLAILNYGLISPTQSFTWYLYTDANQLYLANDLNQLGVDNISQHIIRDVPQHWAHTYNITTLEHRFFLNGAELTLINVEDSLCGKIGELTVGKAGTLGWYSAFAMDELRFYNRLLSAAEIKKHYELLRLDKKRQPLLVH